MKQKTQQKQVTKELSEVKIEQLSKQPIIESTTNMSDDGKWLIHRTIITDIKPVSYLKKVMASS